MKKALIIALLTASLAASIPASAASTFSDVKDDWSASAIQFMTSNGVLSGYSDGTFRPNNPVTKAEFARVYHKLFPEVGNKATTTSGYADIKGHWAEKDFAALFGSGSWEFADRYDSSGKGFLEPNMQLTRWDIMMLVGLLTKEVSVPRDASGGQTVSTKELLSKISEYTDIKIRPAVGFEQSSLYKPVILTSQNGESDVYSSDNDTIKAELAYASITLGVMNGSGEKFRPYDKVTRAEAVTILYRVYTDLVNK